MTLDTDITVQFDNSNAFASNGLFFSFVSLIDRYGILAGPMLYYI